MWDTIADFFDKLDGQSRLVDDLHRQAQDDLRQAQRLLGITASTRPKPGDTILKPSPKWISYTGSEWPAEEARHLAGKPVKVFEPIELDLAVEHGNVYIGEPDDLEPLTYVRAQDVEKVPLPPAPPPPQYRCDDCGHPQFRDKAYATYDHREVCWDCYKVRKRSPAPPQYLTAHFTAGRCSVCGDRDSFWAQEWNKRVCRDCADLEIAVTRREALMKKGYHESRWGN